MKAKRRRRRKKPAGTNILDRLVAEGRATKPVGDLLELGLPEGKVSRTLSDALRLTRQDRI